MTRSAAPLRALTLQTLREAWAGGRGTLYALAVFSLSVVLLGLNWPIAAGSPKAFVPAVFLALCLLTILTQTERIFQEDFEDGSLSLWMSSDLPLSSFALAKILTHWVIGAWPIALSAPVFALAFGWAGLEAMVFLPLLAGFSLGVYCLGGVVGALTIDSKRNTALIALLIMPLVLPLFVYASAFLLGADWLILGMFISALLLVLSVTPFLCAAALKTAMQ